MAELASARYTPGVRTVPLSRLVKRHRPSGAFAAFAAATGVALLVGACGNAAPLSEDTGAVSSELTTITRSAALARGQEWVTAKVPYCQAPNHQPDDDKACSSTCTRPNNPLWDPYRSDCSGFVSWSWGLAAPGRTTAELAPAVQDITKAIDPLSLLPGDAVNKPSDHTMLFVKWLTPGKRATFIEEPGCSADQPYARQVDSDVTIKGMSITVTENGITFSAIRFAAIADDPDAGTGDADSAPPRAQGDAGGSGVTTPMLASFAPPSGAGGCATTPRGVGGASSGLSLVVGSMLLLAARRRRKARATSHVDGFVHSMIKK
jgi:hypothetical protein